MGPVPQPEPWSEESSREGEVISGRYELLQEIGRGGMGRVYRARHVDLDRIVALKLLDPKVAVPHAAKRFLREATATASLRHPNIVDVLDFGHTEDGSAFIVMEFVSGRTLSEVAEQEVLTWPRARHYLKQLGWGLKRAHETGLVHRDLKPDNCMVDDRDQLKILDFGIVKSIDTDTTALTSVGELVGTPEYMSPEQARGQDEIDARTDVYAVGIIAYELVTGDVPFSGPHLMSVLMKHVQDEPVPPSRRNPSISPELDAVILRALAKQPEHRFASMDDLLDALEAVPESSESSRSASAPLASRSQMVRTGATRVASVPSSMLPSSRSSPRRGWLVGAVLVVLAGLAVGMGWLLTSR
jgi:eukaryotic-like serine/threonine-protein kinase